MNTSRTVVAALLASLAGSLLFAASPHPVARMPLGRQSHLPHHMPTHQHHKPVGHNQAHAPHPQGQLLAVRHLAVVNKSGQPLMVFVSGGLPLTWQVKPNHTIRLAVNGVPVTANRVLIWAASENKTWTAHAVAPLILVAKPYRAKQIETFTHTFR
jgi:hypothetical protein